MSALIKGSDPDPIYILRSGPHSVSSLKFAAFGCEGKEVLLSGSQKGLIQIWDLKSRRVQLKLEACNGKGILYADIINVDEEEVIISHGRNGCVQFWCVGGDKEWEVKKTLYIYEYGYCPIAVYQKGCRHWLAYPSSGESQFSIRTIDLNVNTSDVAMKPDDKRGIVMQIKLFSREEKTMHALVGYEDGSVGVWNVLTFSLLHSTKVHSDPVMCVDVDHCSSKFISASADHTIHMLRIDQEFKLEKHVSHESLTSGFACACVRKDCRIVVCGGWDGRIRVFGWKKLKPLAILKYHKQVVNNICFSGEKLIAAASKDGNISIWDVYKGS